MTVLDAGVSAFSMLIGRQIMYRFLTNSARLGPFVQVRENQAQTGAQTNATHLRALARKDPLYSYMKNRGNMLISLVLPKISLLPDYPVLRCLLPMGICRLGDESNESVFHFIIID